VARILTKIHGDRLRHISNGIVITATIVDAIASGGMIYLPRFMKIGTGVQATLRFCLRNSRGCNVGITDGRCFFNYAFEMSSGNVTYRVL
jgi:uncharacterized protein YraI